MTRVLVVQSSPPNPGSLSRSLVDAAVDQIQASSAAHEFCFRDLGVEPLDHIDAAFVAARHETSHSALSLSDQVIAEWKWAELVILGAPMHNLSVSSRLKAYIDHLLRAGGSVNVILDEAAPMGYRMVGLLAGRRVLALLTRGGRYGSPEAARFDFQKPYLAAILGFTGVEIDFIAAEGPTPAEYERTGRAAREAIRTHPWLNAG